MSVYHGSKKDQIQVLDKDYGKSLNKDNVKDFVDVFFDKENESITSETLKNVVLARLRGIQAMYSGQQIFHIYSAARSSLSMTPPFSKNKNLPSRQLSPRSW